MSSLFSPIKLGSLELANRIVVSPMCQYSADDGSPTDWHLAHLGMLANCGAGLVIVEATHVERGGRITHGCTGLYSDHNEAAMARVIEHCRRVGTAKWGIQIAHAGRKASSQRPWEGGGALLSHEDPWQTIAPSAIPFGPNWHLPREAALDDITRVREAFVKSAERAVRIGFDAIELHYAHGYLAHSFLSPVSNKRADRYGVPIAESIKREAGIATRVVGLITTPAQAEAIVAEGKADMVALARAMLDDPRWGWHAAVALGAEVARVPQYLRAGPKLWAPAAQRRA
jgi:2,4-dienoyl-CoA reductase-like NADH-dependent reductase (Old Yellow Enzyme family)